MRENLKKVKKIYRDFNEKSDWKYKTLKLKSPIILEAGYEFKSVSSSGSTFKFRMKKTGKIIGLENHIVFNCNCLEEKVGKNQWQDWNGSIGYAFMTDEILEKIVKQF